MKSKRRIFLWGMLAAGIILFIFSLTNGAVSTSPNTVWSALFSFDPHDQMQQIIRNLRLPRVIAAFLVGSSFAASGALMQAVTNNPLADAGLLGINSGASLGLALSFVLFPNQSLGAVVFSFIGACFAAVCIYLVTRFSAQGISPVRLVLAGVAFSSFFSALSQSLSLFFDLQQDLAFWFVGGAASVTWTRLLQSLPIFLFALVGSLLIAAQLNVLSFGDETAISLGKKPTRIRGISLFLVVLLAGAAVSLVGPVSFIGLMVPHVVRRISSSYRYVVPFSIIGGGLLVMAADLAARLINPPFETPFGLLLSMIGVPFLLYQIRRSVR